jgi:hypothetical protein
LLELPTLRFEMIEAVVESWTWSPSEMKTPVCWNKTITIEVTKEKSLCVESCSNVVKKKNVSHRCFKKAFDELDRVCFIKQSSDPILGKKSSLNVCCYQNSVSCFMQT